MAISWLSAALGCKFLPVRRPAISPPLPIHFLHSNFIPKRTFTFPSCSISSNADYKPIVTSKLIVNSSPDSSFSVRNLFEYKNQQYKYNVWRMLASSLVVLALVFISSFFTQPSAWAASYGRMGSSSRSSGTSSGSSSSWSSRRSKTWSSRPSKTFICYNDSDDDSSVCGDTNCYQGKRKSCNDCDCFKEREKERISSSDVDSSSSLVDAKCDCKCHMPCKCKCHSLLTVSETAEGIFKILLITFFVVSYITGETSKTDMSNKDNVRRGSVLMVQVGILDKKRELQRKLNRIAETADTYTISGLNNLKKEVVKALLEHHDSCHFAHLFAKYDDMKKYSKPCFRGFLETELARFSKEDETFVNVEGVKYKKKSAGNVTSIDNEYSVVTLLVLAGGEYWIQSLQGDTPHVNKVDVKTALQKILSIQGSDLEAVEVLWTPQTEIDSISEQDLLRDFGLLMRPVLS